MSEREYSCVGRKRGNCDVVQVPGRAVFTAATKPPMHQYGYMGADQQTLLGNICPVKIDLLINHSQNSSLSRNLETQIHGSEALSPREKG